MKEDKNKEVIPNNPSVKQAKEKIEKVLVQWFTDDPVMLGVYCLVDKVPDPKQKTLGISTMSNPPCIKFNPNFVNTISQERLECVLVQEGFKLLLKHPTTRLAKPKHISALSSSVTVTPMSLGPLMNMSGMEDIFPTPSKFGLPDGKYYEDYFRRLMDKQEQINDILSDMFGQVQQQPGNGESQSGQGQQQTGEVKSQSGQGQDEGQKDENGYQKFDDQNEAMEEYFNPDSTNTDEWGENDLFDVDVQQMVNEKKHSTRGWGKYTGDAMGDIVAANTPKISWKEIVRRFARSVMSRRTVSSRMKMNRRYGLTWPGARREYDTEIIFALDVSGSMSNDDIAEGLAVINSTCGHAKITYIMFDTKIKKVENDFKKARGTFKVYGRGGTDFQCIVDYANERNVDGVVIFTDGYASEPSKLKGKTKMLWLLHDKDQKPPCKWGFAAYLDRYENTH